MDSLITLSCLSSDSRFSRSLKLSQEECLSRETSRLSLEEQNRTAREMDRAVRDKQYSPSKWVTRCSPSDVISLHVSHCETLSKEAAEHLATELLMSYSSADNDSPGSVSFFFKSRAQQQRLTDGKEAQAQKGEAAEDGNLKVIVYLHGGYWTAGVLEDCGAFFAEAVVRERLLSADVEEGESEVIVATVQYHLSPPTKMSAIVASVCDGIEFICKRFPAAEIILCGHSAGAHLAGMILSQELSAMFGVSKAKEQTRFSQVSRFLLVSGIYDLGPIQQSCVNEEAALGLTEEDVQRCSPAQSLAQLKRDLQSNKDLDVRQSQLSRFQVEIVVGQHDSPEFIRQSRMFSETCSALGITANFEVLWDYDHFSIVEALSCEGSGPLSKLRKLV